MSESNIKKRLYHKINVEQEWLECMVEMFLPQKKVCSLEGAEFLASMGKWL